MPAGHTMGLLGGYSLVRSFAWERIAQGPCRDLAELR
jgi:hypothetical protein